MREPPALPEERLRVCLRDAWDAVPDAIEFLPMGLDTRAGVFRVTSAAGAPWLVKVKSGPFAEPGCLVPAYLRALGVREVVAPLPTTSGALWVNLTDWTVIVYPFIAGDTGWRSVTDAQWELTGDIFRRIHQVSLPPHGAGSLRRETFDPSAYIRAIHTYESRQMQAPPQVADEVERTLHAAWLKRQPIIRTILARMERLAPSLRRRNLPAVICHADLHPGNLLRDPGGGVHVIDWDEVMLAPKERDFIFVGDTRATSSSGPAPFFRGYGAVEIDWAALTYYRYERIIQDVIACADDVCYRDDLSDAARLDAAALFGDVLAEGGMRESADVAARRLPPGLLISARDA